MLSLHTTAVKETLQPLELLYVGEGEQSLYEDLINRKS